MSLNKEDRCCVLYIKNVLLNYFFTSDLRSAQTDSNHRRLYSLLSMCKNS